MVSRGAARTAPSARCLAGVGRPRHGHLRTVAPCRIIAAPPHAHRLPLQADADGLVPLVCDSGRRMLEDVVDICVDREACRGKAARSSTLQAACSSNRGSGGAPSGPDSSLGSVEPAQSRLEPPGAP